MPSAAEPPNGDFVAFIEQLQRESAARILAQAKQVMVEPPAGPVPGSSRSAATRPAAPSAPVGSDGYGFGNAAHSADDSTTLPLSRLDADKLLARFASERAKAQQIGASISLVIGIALIFYWFATRAGAVPLLLGVALLVWSIRKLRRGTAQRANAQQEAGRAAVSKVFGHVPRDR
jgi:hypothetical protein